MPNQTASDQIFKTLSFQYQPLEKALIAQLKKEGRDDVIANYQSKPSGVKIMILDKFASMLDL